MEIGKLQIKIIDTNDNTLVNSDEYTQHHAPRLIYNGADDKFNPILAGQLVFSMEANQQPDGVFLHLFTGSETRYKVLLEDHSDPLNIISLWQGWLFAEQYSEVYRAGAIFVKFNATDGLATLKTKTLPDGFYSENKSLTLILAECLKLTGSELPFYIAPPIVNAVADFDSSKKEIDTSIFIDEKGVKDNAYAILEALILGSTIFQWGQKWYIIGINRFKEISLSAESFNASGTYIEGVTLSRSNELAKFEADPVIQIQPPLKSVEISWDVDESYNLLPENIVYQSPVVDGVFQGDGVQFWSLTGSGLTMDLKDTSYFGHPWAFFGATINPILESDAFYLALNGSLDDTVHLANYIDLDMDPEVYIKGVYNFGQTVDFKCEGVIWFDGSISSGLDSDLYYLLYQITVGTNILVSNNGVFDWDNIYDFTYEEGETSYQIKFSLDLKNFPVNDSGSLGIRFWTCNQPTTGPTLLRTVFTKMSLVFNDETGFNTIEKIRGINYSKNKTLSALIGSSVNSENKKKIQISASVPFTSFDRQIAAADILIAYNNYYFNTYYVYLNQAITDQVIIFLNEDEYYYLQANRDRVYIKRNSDGSFYQLIDFVLVNHKVHGYILIETNATSPILAADEIYVRFFAETITETDREYMQIAWKRYGIDENIGYLEALARIYHDVTADPIKSIDGKLFGLYGPLDLLEFSFVDVVNYQPTRLDLDLSDNMTNVTLLECKNKNVADYVD